ncbi:hypothetical protein UFOVP585_45 [uncultured Caudovirales phage]|uniref:Uncharacterized protein n=1 Tax=uncultured Caudovirales phage TaxID=2100421 RepID=A0A6J5N3W2_9CAUD|nr:hypothetical protein UFOVP585_45 [uncultured Caudovirales phage]
MQLASNQFTVEERDDVRKIAQNLQVSWKKSTNLSRRTFTIGVSIIGGNDIIGINPGAVGSPGIYEYFDESDYILSLAWERELSMPYGGLVKAMGEAVLENTSGRFTPRFMGGNSELFTAQLPRRPVKLSTGFVLNGTDEVIPQFSGITTKTPQIDVRNEKVTLEFADYVDFFQGRYLDQTIMFTGQRTDQVMQTLFSQLGMTTAQYDLDYGINIIPFGIFEKDSQFSKVFHDLARSENGHLYQDETGVFKFENRQHWDSAPYNSVRYILPTAQVIEQDNPTDDHIINVVEISSTLRQKNPTETIFNLPADAYLFVKAGSSIDRFLEFNDPILEVIHPSSSGTNSVFIANSLADGTGTDLSGSVDLKVLGTFAKTVKYRFTNTGTVDLYINQLVIAGRPAKDIGTLYYRDRISSSVTAYEERVLKIENPYIQDESWAKSLASMILSDFSRPENVQTLTIRALPRLQFGDLISWQGRYWRVFGIKNRIEAGIGYVQDITILQRTITTYFRIGISTIGGSDMIAP